MAEGPICLFDDYLRVMNKREPTWTKISRNLHVTDSGYCATIPSVLMRTIAMMLSSKSRFEHIEY